MNDNLTEIIEQYLKIETNYAVIINGGYGIGKTYFFKNSLSYSIKNISIPRDKQKKYLPIHISLFGINSVEEVQSQIFFALFPILKNKKLKLAAGIGKSIIRGIAQVSKLGDIDKYIADIDVNAKDWINYDEIVLCFDDLDRKSDSLKIKDIFGFINTLVENYGAKIIIIANEKTLLNDKNYTTELREKVIGVSIQFKSNIELIFDLIINERYSSGYKIYFNFLQDHKNQIIEIIKKNDNNLRNLIFFLEHFKVIFHHLTLLFNNNKDFNVSKKDKLKIVLDFSLAVAIEYKIGYLNSSNFEEIQRLNDYNFHDFDLLLTKQTDKITEAVKSYSDLFKEKYFSNKNYHYIDSIFRYIIGQSAFNIENLKIELDKLFIVENGEISETQKILNQLGYFNCLDLTDKNYRTLTNKMIRFVENGKFKLSEYPTAFHFATRFNNVLGFNIDKLKNKFKKGIKKGNVHYKIEKYLHFRLVIDKKTEFKEDLKEIMNYCINTNNKIEKIKDKENIKELEALFESDFLKFIEKAQEDNGKYKFTPFWLDISINKVYQVLNQLSNNNLVELAFYFQNRYRIDTYEKLYPEIDFLINLKNKINFPKKRKIKNLRNASLDFLVRHIDESINNFPKK